MEKQNRKKKRTETDKKPILRKSTLSHYILFPHLDPGFRQIGANCKVFPRFDVGVVTFSKSSL